IPKPAHAAGTRSRCRARDSSQWRRTHVEIAVPQSQGPTHSGESYARADFQSFSKRAHAERHRRMPARHGSIHSFDRASGIQSPSVFASQCSGSKGECGQEKEIATPGSSPTCDADWGMAATCYFGCNWRRGAGGDFDLRQSSFGQLTHANRKLRANGTEHEAQAQEWTALTLHARFVF